MENNETNEVIRSKWPLWIRILSLVLVIVFIAELVLMNATRVSFSSDNYDDTEYSEMADYIEENDEYLSANRIQRMRDVIRTIGQPRTFDEYSLFASVALADEDYTKAEQYLQGCVERFEGENSELSELFVKLGCVCGMENEWGKATGHFNNAVKRNPDNSNAWLMLAESYLRGEKYEPALEAMNKYFEFEEPTPDQLMAIASMQLATGDYAGCAETCKNTLTMENCPTADMYFISAQANMMLGNFDTCLDDCDKCLENGGAETDVLPIKANVLEVEERFGEAFEIYSKLLDAGVTDYDTYEHTIQCAYMTDMYDKMLELSNKALEQRLIPTQKLEAKKWLGIAQLQLGDYENAVVNLSEYLDTYDDADELYYLRGVCYMATGNNELAEKDFTASIDAGELIDECLYNRALCRISSGDAEGAAADFQQIVDRDASPEIVAMTLELLGIEGDKETA